MSSVAGKIGYPFLGAYVASKHGLEGMSEALRRELLLFGIDVIVIGPGVVGSAMWDKVEAEDLSAYRIPPMRSPWSAFVSTLSRGGKRT